MSRQIQGEPKTVEEAIYLLDRARLPASLRKVTRGARSREQALNRLTDHFDKDEDILLVDYADMTNDDLREELRNRDLPTDGNKADLVARLEESDAEEE